MGTWVEDNILRCLLERSLFQISPKYCQMVVTELHSLKNNRLKKKNTVHHLLCKHAHNWAACSFFGGIYRDFSNSTVTHGCRVWISTDICVWWETLGLTGLTKRTPGTPHVLTYHIQIPHRLQATVCQVRALSKSCSSRQVLIEDANNRKKKGKQSTLTLVSSCPCWENGDVKHSQQHW